MRVWALLCLTIFSGIIDFDTYTPPQPPTTQPDFFPITWNVPTERSTPEEILNDVFQNQSEYLIRTRVVIEFVTFKNLKGENVTMYGSSPSDIKNDFKNAEDIYSNLGLKFQITQVVFKEYQIGIDHFKIDAINYRDSLSVYFLLPHAFPFEGMSAFPWCNNPCGVLLTCLRDQYTLSHEVGHYFGLLHTFQSGDNGDFCDDTCEQDEFCEAEDANKTPNCRNVMNYCSHSPQFATDDQIFRMRRFLRAERRNHIIYRPPSIPPEIDKMYNSLLELILDLEEQNATTAPSENDSKQGNHP